MQREFTSYTPDSLRTPSQIITAPRTDGAPPCIQSIVEISHVVEETRSDITKLHPSEIDETQKQTLWYEHHQTSLILLRQFMTQQVITAFDAATDPKVRRQLEEYHVGISSRHIFDSIYLLIIEPQLFLSNLTAEEVAAIYKLCQQLGQYEQNEVVMTGLRLYATALLTEQARW